MLFCYLLLLFFFKINFSSDSMDLDQVHHFVVPDLGPNCLQRLLLTVDTYIKKFNMVSL